MNLTAFFEGFRSSKPIHHSTFFKPSSFIILHSAFYIVIAAVLCAAMTAGCVSFEQTFTNSFIDEDGNIVSVVNGRLSSDHVFKVPSPGNGKIVDYKSKEAIRITLPDGQEFTAYQTLNTMPIGNMYMTDDENLVYVTNGLMCRIYALLEDGSDHLLIYEGNLTKSPEEEQ